MKTYIIQVTQAAIATVAEGHDLNDFRHPDHQGCEIGEGECTCETIRECIGYDLLYSAVVLADRAAEYACCLVEDKTASYRFAVAAMLQDEIGCGDTWWCIGANGQQEWGYAWGTETDVNENILDKINATREINVYGAYEVMLHERGNDDLPLWDTLPLGNDICNAAEEGEV